MQSIVFIFSLPHLLLVADNEFSSIVRRRRSEGESFLPTHSFSLLKAWKRKPTQPTSSSLVLEVKPSLRKTHTQQQGLELEIVVENKVVFFFSVVYSSFSSSFAFSLSRLRYFFIKWGVSIWVGSVELSSDYGKDRIVCPLSPTPDTLQLCVSDDSAWKPIVTSNIVFDPSLPIECICTFVHSQIEEWTSCGFLPWRPCWLSFVPYSSSLTWIRLGPSWRASPNPSSTVELSSFRRMTMKLSANQLLHWPFVLRRTAVEGLQMDSKTVGFLIRSTPSWNHSSLYSTVLCQISSIIQSPISTSIIIIISTEAIFIIRAHLLFLHHSRSLLIWISPGHPSKGPKRIQSSSHQIYLLAIISITNNVLFNLITNVPRNQLFIDSLKVHFHSIPTLPDDGRLFFFCFCLRLYFFMVK